MTQELILLGLSEAWANLMVAFVCGAVGAAAVQSAIEIVKDLAAWRRRRAAERAV